MTQNRVYLALDRNSVEEALAEEEKERPWCDCLSCRIARPLRAALSIDHEEVVERMARALADASQIPWKSLGEIGREVKRHEARAALDSLADKYNE